CTGSLFSAGFRTLTGLQGSLMQPASGSLQARQDSICRSPCRPAFTKAGNNLPLSILLPLAVVRLPEQLQHLVRDRPRLRLLLQELPRDLPSSQDIRKSEPRNFDQPFPNRPREPSHFV